MADNSRVGYALANGTTMSMVALGVIDFRRFIVSGAKQRIRLPIVLLLIPSSSCPDTQLVRCSRNSSRQLREIAASVSCGAW